MVVIVPLALTDGAPVDLTVSVVVSVVPLVAPPGTSTRTQTSADEPPAMLTEASAVVQVSSRTADVNDPDVAASEYVSASKPTFEIWPMYVTDGPGRARSVWVAGAKVTAYAGAIGVGCALPEALIPCAEVTLRPSLTMAVTVDPRLG